MYSENIASSREVLAIDDEADLLQIVKIILEDEGYRVRATTSPLEAIEIYRKHWQSIALVVSDYNMPELTGAQVLARLRCINPHAAMLLVTGSRDDLSHDFSEHEVVGLVRKPFRLDELVTQVNEAVQRTAKRLVCSN